MLNILIPTDFSENARQAARYAFTVFGADNTYTLLHAYEVPHSGATMLITISEILEKDSIQLLKEDLSLLEDEFPDFKGKISIKASLGQPETCVRKFSEQNPCDMVVMGTKGAGGIKGVLLGSVASNVLEQVKCPIIVVPQKANLDTPSKVLFAVDDTTLNENLFPTALADITKRFDAELMVLNIVDEGKLSHVGTNEPTRIAISAFDNVKHSFHFAENKEPMEGIRSFLAENKIDLLAMVNRRDDLFSKLFGTSTTRQMVMKSDVPIIAFK